MIILFKIGVTMILIGVVVHAVIASSETISNYLSDHPRFRDAFETVSGWYVGITAAVMVAFFLVVIWSIE